MVGFRKIKVLLAAGLIALVGKYCVTTARYVETLTRQHQVEEKVFAVSGPLVVHGQTQVRIEKHFFDVESPAGLRGKILHVRVSPNNEHGQDVILHYEDSSADSKAALLFGADDAISNRLRTLAWPLGQPGSSLDLEGAQIQYRASTWDGSEGLDVNKHLTKLQAGKPPTEEVGLTDGRFIGKKFSYFLVTRLPQPG